MTIEELKQQFQNAAQTNQNPQHSVGACPNCGYCPHCGRGAQTMPYQPWFPSPIWISPTYPGYPTFPQITYMSNTSTTLGLNS